MQNKKQSENKLTLLQILMKIGNGNIKLFLKPSMPLDNFENAASTLNKENSAEKLELNNSELRQGFGRNKV